MPLPNEFRLEIDPGVRADGDLVVGGSPRTALRLSPSGREAWQSLGTRPVGSRAEGLLARRLTDLDLASPMPPPQPPDLGVTVVVPVHGRSEMLERCLAALGSERRVIVVDDASPDPGEVAEVARRHGAYLMLLPHNRGPAGARNAALDHVGTELVAFLDSDCVAPRGWLEAISLHFHDPLVAAVAPRIRPLPAEGPVAAYSATDSCLDMGPVPGRVGPGRRVAYVPTAALVMRTRALEELGAHGVFDERMRVGEDVDLVWRLDAAGWRVRYDPSVAVAHEEPATWNELLARRFRYGNSAAPLARRHPEAMAPVRIAPLPALAVGAALARRPALSLGAAAAAAAMTARVSRGLGFGVVETGATVGRQLLDTLSGMGRATGQLGLPLAAAAALVPPPGRRSRLVAVAVLLGTPIVRSRGFRDTRMNRLGYSLARLADDAAYGAGVWRGASTERDLRALLPRLVRRRAATGGAASPGPQPPGGTHEITEDREQ